MGQPRPLFCLFSVFSNTNSKETNCRFQQDSNSDCRELKASTLTTWPPPRPNTSTHERHKSPKFKTSNYRCFKSLSDRQWRHQIVWNRFSSKSLLMSNGRTGKGFKLIFVDLLRANLKASKNLTLTACLCKRCISKKMGHSWAFFFIFVFSTSNNWFVHYKILMMTRFEP